MLALSPGGLAALAAAALAALAIAAPAAAVPDRAPIASPAPGRSAGTVILIHGGAWIHHGPRYALRQHLRHAARLNRLGFDTVAITYRPGALALGDVVAAYDALRRRRGHREPICSLGDSAGGHLSLMLAARRPGLDCAISRGAPTDLRFAHGIWRPAVERLLAPHAPLESISPVFFAQRLAGRAVASHARHDPLVDHSQLVRLRHASGGEIRTVTLPPGRAAYVHAPVNAAALGRLERREAQLLRSAASRFPASTSQRVHHRARRNAPHRQHNVEFATRARSSLTKRAP